MSDFDEVLERLVIDPVFQARLTTEPDAALAGYRLEPHERELLTSQVVAGDGADRTVEVRTSKSGVVGMIGPVISAMGVAAAESLPRGGISETFGAAPGTSTVGAANATGTFGAAPGTGTFGLAPHGSGPGTETLGAAGSATPGTQTLGAGVQSAGSAGGPAQTLGTAQPSQTMGAAEPIGATMGAAEPVGATMGAAEPVGATMGAAEPVGATMGSAPTTDHIPATGYHTHVDADGDGHWDTYRAYERPDGGVDVEVDMDRDGRVDFIGHDRDRDGLIDDAVFDNNHDGAFETRMVDDNGDGWMDRVERIGQDVRGGQPDIHG